MKQAIFLASLALIACFAYGETTHLGSIWRCGAEYTNTITSPAHGCVLVTGTVAARMAQNRPSFEPIGETVDGYLFIDRSSVKIQGKLTKAWTLFSSKDVYVDMYGKKSSSAMTNTIYNCKDDTYAMKQSVQYAGDTGTGVVVSSLLIPDSKLEFVDPVPGSTGAIELARACSLGSKK